MGSKKSCICLWKKFLLSPNFLSTTESKCHCEHPLAGAWQSLDWEARINLATTSTQCVGAGLVPAHFLAHIAAVRSSVIKLFKINTKMEHSLTLI